MSRSPVSGFVPFLLFALFSFSAFLPLLQAQAAGQDPAAGRIEEAAVAEEVVAEEEGKEDIFSLLWKGGWIMIPIGLASVLALTLTIERFISLRRSRATPAGFLEGLRSIYGQGGHDAEKSAEYCRQNKCVLATLIESAIPKIPRGERELQNSLEDAGAREVDRMKRSLKPLSMIATVSPLLGLLGTVYGMIGAFQAASNAGTGKSDVLAQGIYEALVTTAAGLTLAIPVLIVYQVLNNRVDTMVDDLDSGAEEFIGFALESPNS
jgi:biopolymer transport protein ExbB